MKPHKPLFLLILFALLLNGASEYGQNRPSVSSQAEKHKSKTEEHSSTGNYKGNDTENSPEPMIPSTAIIEIPGQETQAESTQIEQSTIEKWFNPMTAPDWAIVFVTIVYVIVAIGQLIAIRRQAKFARRTLHSIRRQTDTAADTLIETRKAADAAKTNADTAGRQTALIFSHERPWIAVKPQKPANWPLPPKNNIGFPLVFDFLWSANNVGRTPAFIKEISVAARIRSFPQPNENIEYGSAIKTSNFIIPPNGDHSERWTCVITETQHDNIAQGNECIIFYGYVKYDDTLEGKEHITCFCSYWHYQFGIDIFNPVGPEGWTEYT